MSILAGILLAATAANADQIVTPLPASQTVAPSAVAAIDINYTTSPADVTLTGLTLTLHYDSTRLTFEGPSNVFTHAIVGQQTLIDDELDEDGDPATDKLFLISWADTAGNWPGTIPQRLFTGSFRAVGPAGVTPVRIRARSTAAGHALAATDATVTVSGGGGGGGGSIYVPGQAYSQGSGTSFFVSSAWLTNPGASPLAAELEYLPGSGAARTTPLTIPARGTTAFQNVLRDAFGISPPSSGTLRVRATGAQPIVTARTFNDAGALGTFGQYIPGVTASFRNASIYGLGGDADSRSNVGVVNVGSTAATVTLTVIDTAGTPRGNPITFPLSPGAFSQINRVNEAASAGSLAVFGVRIAATGDVYPYASKLDNLTSDPIFVAAGLAARARQWIDGVASAPGAGTTQFRSSFSITNPGTTAASVALALTRRGETAIAATRTLILAAGESRFYADVIGELFGFTPAAGWLAITTAESTPVVAWTRTYNDTGAAGTFGQFIPAFGPADLFPASGAALTGLSENSAFRTNAGFLNTGTSATGATVTAWSSSGGLLASKRYEFSGSQAIFVSRIFQNMGIAAVSDAWLQIVPDTGGSLYAWASSVDNVSTDQIFVRPHALP